MYRIWRVKDVQYFSKGQMDMVEVSQSRMLLKEFVPQGYLLRHGKLRGVF
jgi:hypothetical protein